VIDHSLDHASSLTRQLFGDRWTADAVERFVNRVAAASVATVRPDGRPHAVLVVVACLDGVIHFSVTPGSVLLRDLKRDDRVALTVSDMVSGVMAEGRARPMGCGGEIEGLLVRLGSVVDRRVFTPPGWDGCVYALEPDRLFAA
jgi:hypothetical protein